VAGVLVECATSFGHAYAIINSFDTNFPTAHELRKTAKELEEPCRCGITKWEHAQKGCDHWYGTQDRPYIVTDNTKADRKAWSRTTDWVPQIPGVRWDVSLMVEDIYIALGLRDLPPDEVAIRKHEREFPEAVAAIRAGRQPDYKLVEEGMAS
jgi:hypothetical protein